MGSTIAEMDQMKCIVILQLILSVLLKRTNVKAVQSVSRITVTAHIHAHTYALVLNASVQKDMSWIRAGKNVLILM